MSQPAGIRLLKESQRTARRRSRFDGESGLNEIVAANAALRLGATVSDRAGGRLPSQVEARWTVGVNAGGASFDRLRRRRTRVSTGLSGNRSADGNGDMVDLRLQ